LCASAVRARNAMAAAKTDGLAGSFAVHEVTPAASAGAGAVAAAMESGGGALVRTHIGLRPNKAGMDGVDARRIEQVVLDASRGSKFFDKAVRKSAELDKRIAALRERAAHQTDWALRRAREECLRRAADIEAAVDMARTFCHIDMDAFYAAIHEREDPSLRAVPMAVVSSWAADGVDDLHKVGNKDDDADDAMSARRRVNDRSVSDDDDNDDSDDNYDNTDDNDDNNNNSDDDDDNDDNDDNNNDDDKR
jgi:hypothetical protein